MLDEAESPMSSATACWISETEAPCGLVDSMFTIASRISPGRRRLLLALGLGCLDTRAECKTSGRLRQALDGLLLSTDGFSTRPLMNHIQTEAGT